jgi:hypothetical protein
VCPKRYNLSWPKLAIKIRGEKLHAGPSLVNPWFMTSALQERDLSEWQRS